MSAQAVADRADLAGAVVAGAQLVDGRLEVGHALVHVELVHVAQRFLPLLRRLVRELDARPDAPEQVGADGQEAFAGQAVAGLAHDSVDAEDLLDHDDAGPGAVALGDSQVGVEFAIGGLDGPALVGHRGGSRC